MSQVIKAAAEAQHPLLQGKVMDWFPLLPRTRPAGQALHLRIDEIRGLACSASHGPDQVRLSSAAQALNKAALIASDCGLVDLARQLCWRQFDIFQAATPLTAKTAKLALQPIVNLGRLATRGGDGTRAYRIFENAYTAVRTQTATEIDGRDIDFRHFVSQTQERHELRKFLWTILLADGTRALTKAGRWGDALRHLEQHKGIGKRMLDGRQVAILARCTTGDHDGALDILDDSSTPDPWEHAVATCLRTLCLRISNQPADTSAAAMVRAYLRLEPSPEHILFRTRLGLCAIDLGVTDLAADAHRAGTSPIIARVIREAVASADTYSASDVLSHQLCHSNMAQADEDALADIVEMSGLRRATMPANLLADLMTSETTSEAQLAQVLARGTHYPSTA
ncbi:MAG: hypothetical protein ACRDSL_18785 [Pseudonocardiaceae bacterium]